MKLRYIDYTEFEGESYFMILDGVLYAVIHSGSAMLCVKSSPF